MFEVKASYVTLKGHTLVTLPKFPMINNTIPNKAAQHMADAIVAVIQEGHGLISAHKTDYITRPLVKIEISGLELDVLLDTLQAKPIETPRKGMTLYSFGSSLTPIPERKTWIMNFDRVFEPAVLNMKLPRNVWYRLYDEDHKRWESSYFRTPGDTRQYWGTPQTP